MKDFPLTYSDFVVSLEMWKCFEIHPRAIANNSNIDGSNRCVVDLRLCETLSAAQVSTKCHIYYRILSLIIMLGD